MTYQANFSFQTLTAVFDLKGRPDDITHRLSDIGLGPDAVLKVAPEHWLVRAPLAQEDQVFAQLTQLPCASDTLIVNVSDAYVFFSLDGVEAEQLMAIASPIDAQSLRFGAAGATFTEVFGQKALLIRWPAGFEIGVERSYSTLIADYFSRANGQASGI